MTRKAASTLKKHVGPFERKIYEFDRFSESEESIKKLLKTPYTTIVCKSAEGYQLLEKEKCFITTTDKLVARTLVEYQTQFKVLGLLPRFTFTSSLTKTEAVEFIKLIK